MTPDEHLDRLEIEADRQGQEIARLKDDVQHLVTEIRNTTNAARRALDV